jgi:phosphate acetyltransferase
MNNFIQKIRAEAQKSPKRIVFPDASDPRVIEAALVIKNEGLAIPILDLPLNKVENYTAEFAKIRGVTIEEAREKMKDRNYFATMMLQMGDADAMIAGPISKAHERILPAFQVIKTREAGHKVSGFNFMVLDENTDADAANGGVLIFADVAVNVDPTPDELAQIAIDSAETAKRFWIKPKIAMLSFSTAGSSNDIHAEKVREATKIVKNKRPDLQIEGEIQVDAALIDKIGEMKAPGSLVAGHANVLIFPDLEAGNIGYKLVERLAGAKVIGPLLQGLRKPVNEVSRGASAEDIVNLAAITSIQASQN